MKRFLSRWKTLLWRQSKDGDYTLSFFVPISEMTINIDVAGACRPQYKIKILLYD